jgi:hypothetical protein
MWGWDWVPISRDDPNLPRHVAKGIGDHAADLFVARGRGDQGSDAYAIYHPSQPTDDEYMPMWVMYVLEQEGLAQVFKITSDPDVPYKQIIEPGWVVTTRKDDPRLAPVEGRRQ